MFYLMQTNFYIQTSMAFHVAKERLNLRKGKVYIIMKIKAWFWLNMIIYFSFPLAQKGYNNYYMEPTVWGRRQAAGRIWSPRNILRVSKQSRNTLFVITARECLESGGHWHLIQHLVSNSSLKKCFPLRCNKINSHNYRMAGVGGKLWRSSCTASLLKQGQILRHCFEQGKQYCKKRTINTSAFLSYF